jgi:hypothetical protein
MNSHWENVRCVFGRVRHRDSHSSSSDTYSFWLEQGAVREMRDVGSEDCLGASRVYGRKPGEGYVFPWPASSSIPSSGYAHSLLSSQVKDSILPCHRTTLLQIFLDKLLQRICFCWFNIYVVKAVRAFFFF